MSSNRPSGEERIEIFCRFRPVSKSSTVSTYKIAQTFDNSTIEFLKPKQHVVGHVNNSRETYDFQFNGIFDTDVTQDDVYDRCAKKCVASALEGYNSTLFAYGQTGSGKTWTMTGGSVYYKDRGVIPRAISHIFEEIANRPEVEFNLYVSYMEIYNNQPYDLLDKNRDIKDLKDLKKLVLQEDKEGTIHFKNYHPIPVRSEEEALEILFVGDQNRALSETQMNEASSRSHCIFTMHIESKAPNSNTFKASKMHLVDLAGSERVYKSGSTGQTLSEAKNINLSLHFLEQVIVALSEKQEHIPYRNSTITWLLRDSLGGNCKTVMVATLNPSREHLEETISTCRFAQRVASIKQQAMVNERVDPVVQITQLKRKVVQLEEELAFLKGEGKDREEIDNNERAIIRQKVEEYVADKDILSELNLGGDHLRIKEAFIIFKQLLIQARKKRPGPSSQTTNISVEKTPQQTPTMKPQSNTIQAQVVPINIQEQLKNLTLGVELRDREIEILVSMLDKKSKERNEVAIQTMDYESGVFRTELKEFPVERSEDSTNQNFTKETINNRIEKEKEGVLRTSKPTYEYSNEKVMQLASTHGMISRAKAFEVFRKSYRQNSVIEKNKSLLKDKIDEAKGIGKELEQTKYFVNKLKEQLVRRRTERAAQGLMNPDKVSSEDEDEERIKEEMIEQRDLYNKLMERMQSLKKEIKYMQNALKSSAEKVQKDFQQWYATTHGQFDSQDSSTYQDNMDNYNTESDFIPKKKSTEESPRSSLRTSLEESTKSWSDTRSVMSSSTDSSSALSTATSRSNLSSLYSYQSGSTKPDRDIDVRQAWGDPVKEYDSTSTKDGSNDFKSRLGSYLSMKTNVQRTSEQTSSVQPKRISLLDRARNL